MAGAGDARAASGIPLPRASVGCAPRAPYRARRAPAWRLASRLRRRAREASQGATRRRVARRRTLRSRAVPEIFPLRSDPRFAGSLIFHSAVEENISLYNFELLKSMRYLRVF